MKRTPRPCDPVQLGKLMVDIATGAVPDGVDDGKAAGAAQSGRLGGAARARSLGAKERAEIARAGAQARWKASSDVE